MQGDTPNHSFSSGSTRELPYKNSIAIPDSVNSIAHHAFNGCSALTEVIYCGTEEQWNNIEIDGYNEDLLQATLRYHDWVGTGTQKTCSVCKITSDGHEHIWRPATEPATQPPTEQNTQPPSESATQPSTQPATEPVTQPDTPANGTSGQSADAPGISIVQLLLIMLAEAVVLGVAFLIIWKKKH